MLKRINKSAIPLFLTCASVVLAAGFLYAKKDTTKGDHQTSIEINPQPADPNSSCSNTLPPAIEVHSVINEMGVEVASKPATESNQTQSFHDVSGLTFEYPDCPWAVRVAENGTDKTLFVGPYPYDHYFLILVTNQTKENVLASQQTLKSFIRKEEVENDQKVAMVQITHAVPDGKVESYLIRQSNASVLFQNWSVNKNEIFKSIINTVRFEKEPHAVSQNGDGCSHLKDEAHRAGAEMGMVSHQWSCPGD